MAIAILANTQISSYVIRIEHLRIRSSKAKTANAVFL